MLSSLAALTAACAIAASAQPANAARSVTVVTEPGAVVWLDGVRFGKTDDDGRLELRAVTPGPHMMRVRADGFKELSRPLAATARGEVSFALVKTSDEAELAFQEAERLISQDRERAAETYRKAIRLRPAYPEAYLGLARVLLDAGDPEAATKALAGLRRLRPGFPEASAIEGRLHKDNGEEARAIAAYKRAISEGKGVQPEAYAGLGLLYKEKAEAAGGSGDFTTEAEYYTESAKYLRMSLKQLSGAPDAIVIYQLLGLIYERQKKYADAIALYEEFLRLFPDLPESTAVRSFIVQLQKDMALQ